MSEPNVTVVSSPRARMNVKTVTSLGMLTAVAAPFLVCIFL